MVKVHGYMNIRPHSSTVMNTEHRKKSLLEFELAIYLHACEMLPNSIILSLIDLYMYIVSLSKSAEQ